MSDQESDLEGQELTRLLEDAANDQPGATEAFFQAFIRSRVYAPVRPGTNAEQWSGAELPSVGEGRLEDFGFLTVDYQGSECLPVFTEREFLLHWAEREIPFLRKEVRSLVWILGEDTWLYLNPNQELGKEFTPWELELIRQGGEDASGELAAAAHEQPLGEVEVRPGNDVFPNLRRSLYSVVELHPEIEEAFLVAVKEGGAEAERPMVGIRFSKVHAQKRDYLRQEMEETAKSHKGEGAEYLFIVDDLHEGESPHRAFFADVTPFYLRPREPSRLEKAKDKLKQAFGKKTKLDAETPTDGE
ncbi:MAG: SseB family protein [Bdellovibrionales bacterium]|nr:SseB family protein [Bdellovibrionales bacterium]